MVIGSPVERLDGLLFEIRGRLGTLGVDDSDLRRKLADAEELVLILRDAVADHVDTSRQLAESRAEVAQLERSMSIVADDRARRTGV